MKNIMKNITIKGKTFGFEVCRTGEFGEYLYTCFYYGVDISVRKKYYLFGEKITIETPRFAFSVEYDIEDVGISKEDLRNRLENELKSIEKLLDRKSEIMRGEYI